MERKKHLCGKKGSIQDFALIIVSFVAVALAVLICFNLIENIGGALRDSGEMPDESIEAMQSVTNLYPGVLDNVFLLLLVGLCIVALIMAALVRIHPIFIALFVLLLIIVIFLSAVFAHIYESVAEQPAFAEMAAKLTFISHIMVVLPWIVGVLGGALTIVMMKTWEGG